MSELTVPKAPAIVGRTATVRYEDPGYGEAFARLGDSMLAAGTALENDRLDREMMRLKVDMTRDLGQLRLEIEDMGDPDAAGAAWDQGIAALRQRYAGSVNDRGRPLIDPKNAETFDLAFDDLSTSHALALGRRFMALRQSQRAATLFEYEQVLANQASRADPDVRDELLLQYDQNIDDQVARGTLAPEEGARRKAENRRVVENAAVIEVLSEDPRGTIELLDAGEFPALGPEARARYKVAAQTELASRAVAAQKAAQAEAKERAAKIEKRLKDIAGIADAGRVAVDEAWLESPEVKASPDYPRAKAAIELRNEKPGLAMMTPADLDQMIAEEAKKPVAEGFENDRLQVLRSLRDRAVDGLRVDPIEHARTVKMPVPVLDLTNPDGIAEAIAARVTFGQGMVEAGYVKDAKDAPILDREEQAQLKKVFAALADTNAKAALAGDVMAAVFARGGDPARIDAFSADPLLSWVGGMLARNAGSPSLAAEILRGQQAIEAKNLILPPLADRISPAFGQIGTVLADLPGGEGQQGEIVAAADALYAARIRREYPAAPIDKTAYGQALHEVMGGTGGYGSKRAQGGIQEVNGRLTILDPGMRARDIEGAIFQLRRQTYFEAPGRKAVNLDASVRWPASSEAALRAAARTDGLPSINGAPLTSDDWGEVSFAASGPDTYALLYAGRRVLDSETGETFLFSMKRLLQEYGQ